MPRHPRLPPIPRESETILEQRIDYLCRKYGKSVGKLGRDVVGLSTEALPKLVARARKEGAADFPGEAATYLAIAVKCDVSLEWLFGLTEDPTPPTRKR